VGHVPEKLTPQVGSPAWDQALGQKVVWMVAGTQQSASLTLNPPDLGPLQVVLNVSNSQANATFIAAQPEVRQALEAALPKLREMMNDAGIQLGQTTISSGGASQHGGSGEQQQRTSRSFEPVADSTETTISVTRGRTISSGQGMVDTFA
jgi:flagellar hook-length control protein FliK